MYSYNDASQIIGVASSKIRQNGCQNQVSNTLTRLLNPTSLTPLSLLIRSALVQGKSDISETRDAIFSPVPSKRSNIGQIV
jgi:hypothetical protein